MFLQRSIFLYTLGLLFSFAFSTQAQHLPAGFAPNESSQNYSYYTNKTYQNIGGISTAPVGSLRTMAEWEEIQSLVITWQSYPETLSEIVRHARLECEVIIICDDSTQVKTYLNNKNIDLSGVSYIQTSSNSVWMRDYGANTVYKNDVDSLLLIDWIYNRPRPDDDLVPEALATFKNIPLYTTTVAPNDLVHTGGNFMSDGWGTAFSSELILEENEPNNPYNVSVKTEAEIDTIMKNYMGIERYIKMPTLPYDGIHHIDMHMKLLDEETILMGEYPSGVADGPQIEANLQYVLSNFNSVFGTPYKVVRVTMPPGSNGNYPDASPWWTAGEYRTYTNCVFINKTVLVPIYEEEYDTTALRIIREDLPGYNVVGIDCNDVIQASGALHCITRAVGVEDPLWITHQELTDRIDDPNDYGITATIKHRSGIANATLYYKTALSQAYQSTVMTQSGTNTAEWSASIPNISQDGTTVYYYVQAEANSGKTQVRPMPAPDGYWDFKINYTGATSSINIETTNQLLAAYPNPASAITCVPVECKIPSTGSLKLYDILGTEILELHEGQFPTGSNNYFFDASKLETGVYFIVWETEQNHYTQKITIK
ncbi:MAG: agmatine deiminase family protein [Saprospiraceae bacterium]|nr:agmatine deiminase family protein [Saprospiraceae bacterium]